MKKDFLSISDLTQDEILQLFKKAEHLKSLLDTGQGQYGKNSLKVVPTTLADRQQIMPNVVMYDFVNIKTSSEIVELNNPGLIGHVIEVDQEDDDFDDII